MVSMKLKLKLLKPFSEALGKNELELDFNDTTVKDLINVLATRYPQLKKEFFVDNNKVTDYIVVFVNDKPISALRGMNTELNNGDKLLFFLPMSGG
jgi:MoaD family protein